MNRREGINRKLMYCILAVVAIAIFTLTIAYAALNAVLTISGTAEIQSSYWDIYLDNATVKKGSVINEVPTITNRNTVNFDVSFEQPGDFYEFTVDAVNDGDIAAMVDNIIKKPELTEEQAKYIKYEVTYGNDLPITEKQLISPNESILLKVRVEYRDDITNIDVLPSETTKLSLSIALTYIQADDSATLTPGYGKGSIEGSLHEIGSIVNVAGEKFYLLDYYNGKIKLLSMYNLHVGNIVDYNWNITPIVNPTGLQHKNAIGFRMNEYGDRILPDLGVIPFATEEYWSISTSETTKNVYSQSSLLYEHVENYGNYFHEKGIGIREIGILTYQDLMDIGCEVSTCTNTYNWLYNTSYWLGTAENKKYDDEIYCVQADGSIGTMPWNNNEDFGIRPYIVINESIITGIVRPE